MDMPRIAIVSALEREIAPLVRGWRSSMRKYEQRQFRFFENQGTVAVAGGIGAEPARRATEALISLYAPQIVYSVGFAGALNPDLKIGDIVIPRRILDARDCSSIDTGTGDGILVSFSSVASPEQKKNLAESFGAIAVDMEAAFISRAAEARGIRFAAVKAISDDSSFALPPTENFISPDGTFQSGGFALFVAIRPWLWPATARLAQNSRQAARILCARLSQMLKSSGGLVSTKH